MSSFDTARDVRLPGIVIEGVYIDPKQLSTKMKNMVKKMLRQGCTEGGWSSKAKQLALKIAEAQSIMLFQGGTRGFRAPERGTYNLAVAEEVCQLIDADMALELLYDAETYPSHPHGEVIMERTRRQHAAAKQTVMSSTQHRWCYMHSKEMVQEIGAVFATTRSPKQIEAAEKACDMIDRGERIAITLSM